MTEPWKKSGPFGDDDLEFLRSYSRHSTPRRAADEIVRLRAEVEELKRIISNRQHEETIRNMGKNSDD